ncbi:MAG: ABC transporter permease [Thermoleophilia bacterium]
MSPRIWTLATKDLLEARRDRLALLFTVIMPLAFTAFFGIMFQSSSNRLLLAVSNADGGASSDRLVELLEQSSVVKVTIMTADEAETAVDEGRMTAALLIPAGFTAAVLDGRTPAVSLVGMSGSSGVQTALTEVTRAAGTVVSGEMAARAAVAVVSPGEDSSNKAREAAHELATASLADPTASISVIASGTPSGEIPSGFVLSSPGMLINFILFSMLTAGVAVIQERRNSTLLRLMTTRLRRWELIAGKSAGMFLLTLLQQVILISAGELLFGVAYLNSPAALIVVMISLSLVASTLGLLLASLLPSEQALVATTVLVSMSVSALSGAWFPLEVTGETFQAVGHVLPTAWILDALRAIILRGAGLNEVLPAVGVAVAWSVGLFSVAVWRFRLTR